MKYEIATVKTSGFQMEYIRFGSGENPLVILPGISMKRMADSAEGIADAYSILSKDFTVYLFDRRSPVPPDYTIEQMAEDTAKAMQALSLKSVCLFGASQGGAMAIYLCAKHPELVRKAVLGSTFSKPNETSLSVLGRWAETAKAGDYETLQLDFFRTVFSKGFFRKNRTAFTLLSTIGSAEECERFAVLANACLHFDTEDLLPEISCPVLVLGAELDAVATPEASEIIAKKTNGKLYIFPGAGHAAYDEVPDYKEHIFRFFIS